MVKVTVTATVALQIVGMRLRSRDAAGLIVGRMHDPHRKVMKSQRAISMMGECPY